MRNKIYPKTYSLTKVHYFKWNSNIVFTYDVLSKKESKYNLDFEIPYDCRSIATNNGNIFITGGKLNDIDQNLTQEFNPSKNKTVKKQNMNQKRDSHGIAYSSKFETIFVLGGNGGDNYGLDHLKHCEKYLIDNDKWI